MTMVRNGWLLALLLGLPGRAPAQGGTAPKTLYACYLPQSGVVYRVAETDLRFQTPACASQNHVLFSWNDKGEKGDPGNLALAGHTCPAGQFVTGFGTTGGLVCSALFIGGTPPDQYVGQWTLQPAFGAVCTVPDDDVLSGALSFATVNTGFMGAGTIVMSFRGTYVSHLGGPHSNFPVEGLELAMEFAAESRAFGGSGTRFSYFDDQLIVNGGALVVGSFIDANSFTAHVTLSIRGFVRSPLDLGWKEYTCDPVGPIDVTGRRL